MREERGSREEKREGGRVRGRRVDGEERRGRGRERVRRGEK
jgi:hypothetical protein